MFEQSTLDKNSIGKGRKAWTMLASLVLQVLAVVLLAVIPLVFTEALPAVALKAILSVPVPPPPPPAPAADQPVKAARPKPNKPCGLLCIPKVIKDIAKMPKTQEDEMGEPPKVSGPGVFGGVDTSTGTVVRGVPPEALPPPPPAKAEPEKPKVVKIEGPVKVGGRVKHPKLVKMVTPTYPALAKRARIQGTVVFTAVIGRDGAINNLQLVSGHPLLVPAAVEAVKQWVYAPSTLNEELIEVIAQIDVNFKLSQ